MGKEMDIAECLYVGGENWIVKKLSEFFVVVR